MRYSACVGALALGLGLAAAASAFAQDANELAAKRLENSPRHHEWVTLEAAGDHKVRAFVAFPESSEPATGVLVIHENRGLTDWVRGVADRLAEQGYVAIAPDLLSGTGPNGGGTSAYPSQDAAIQGIYKLDSEQVMRDLDAAVKYLRELESTTDTVAVAGFCWGGSTSFQYAAHNKGIAAAFVFYGSAPEDPQAFENINAPVYGFYGENDHRITSKVPEVKKHMGNLGKRYVAEIYDDAGHAFMRQGDQSPPEDANHKASEQAWKRMLGIMETLEKK